MCLQTLQGSAHTNKKIDSKQLRFLQMGMLRTPDKPVERSKASSASGTESGLNGQWIVRRPGHSILRCVQTRRHSPSNHLFSSIISLLDCIRSLVVHSFWDYRNMDLFCFSPLLANNNNNNQKVRGSNGKYMHLEQRGKSKDSGDHSN